MKSKRKLVILVPIANSLQPSSELALAELVRKGYTVWKNYGSSEIARCRSQMATRAIAEGFEEMLWIDSDMQFRAEDVETIRSNKCPIVGALYCTRGGGTFACCFLRGPQEIPLGPMHGRLHEVKWVGTGFLLTRREVYVSMKKHLKLRTCNDVGLERINLPGVTPYFAPVFKRERNKVYWLSEDFSFCERARKCGFRIFVDTRLRLGHIARYRYGWEDVFEKRSERPNALVRITGSNNVQNRGLLSHQSGSGQRMFVNNVGQSTSGTND